MPESTETVQEAPRGRVWLLGDNPREPEIVFDFPFDEELNDAVRELPGRWFNWRLKHWRVPADPRLGKLVKGVIDRFPALEVAPEVHAWLSDSDRWRALVHVGAHDGAGAFHMRTISGDPPDNLARADVGGRPGRIVVPFTAPLARRVADIDGTQLDDLARASARELELGLEPAAAELTVEIGDDGEPELTIYPGWDARLAAAFRDVPEARPVPRAGRFYDRDAIWGVAVPGDPALARAVAGFLEEHP